MGEKGGANRNLHYSLLPEMVDVIKKSIDVEIHPSYNKVDNKRSIANGIESEDILIHRLYGAIEFDGNVYRVKTTMNEHRNSRNEAHDYRVTKVELLESNPTKDADAHVSGSSTSDAQGAPATISGAKLLKGVEKSYDSEKKLLDAEYLSAVKAGDMEKAQKMVSKPAPEKTGRQVLFSKKKHLLPLYREGFLLSKLRTLQVLPA